MHLEPFVMHSALPAGPQPLVRSLQLVDVWTYLERRKVLQRKPISELQGVACHIRSHNITCHPTQ